MQSYALISIDINSLLFGNQEADFLFEVLIRTFVMFLVILVSLRILGKRSVSQLSVFELGVIIGLGSAAGDPMFYQDVGLLPSILAFIVILVLYRIITHLINHHDAMERVLEGVPVYIAEEGKIKVDSFEKELIAHEEFFTQLRLKNVTHLGQIQYAILETNGSVSPFFYPDDDVRWGLPILPHLCAQKSSELNAGHTYACAYCGQTQEVKENGQTISCFQCGRQDWVLARNEPRVK